MNFQDLLSKIKSIDENVDVQAQECGMPMAAVMQGEPPKQQDSVNMNVSMNASGPGGIKDLINVLHSIEQGAGSDHDEPLIDIGADDLAHDLESDKGHEEMLSGEQGMEEFANEPGEKYQSQDYMLNTLAGGADEPQKMNKHGYRNADNPMAMEGLINKLQSHYNRVKEGEEKTMSRAAKGVMKYGKDGMKALAKAGKEGKDLDKVRDKYDKYD